MNYEYFNTDPITTQDGEGIPNPKRAIITLTDDSGNVIERPMLYTNDALDVVKSKKAALCDYEDAYGQGYKLLTLLQENVDKGTRDDVYMAGSRVRQDWSIDTDEGSTIVDKLEADWEDYVSDYKSTDSNLVSEFEPVRVPYKNPSISFYEMGEPSDTIKSNFGIDYEKTMPWYGLKFDKVTKEVVMKVVLQKEEMQESHSEVTNEIEQLIPVYGNHFFAVIYNSSKEMNPNIDVYFKLNYADGSQWCKDMDMAIPYTDESLNSNLLYWGAVYNTEMKKITHVKAYIRNYIEV